MNLLGMDVSGWFGKSIKLTDGGFWSKFFGAGNAAGQVVTLDTALTLSTVWSCVRLISETIATLPLNLYETDGVRRRVAVGHTLQSVLHVSPNAEDTPVEYWEGVVAAIALQGISISLKDKNGVGDVSGLRVPVNSRPVRDSNQRLLYRTTFLGGQQLDLQPDEVFAIKGFSDGRRSDVGLSAIRYGAQTFGNSQAVEESVGKTFANGIQSSGFFQLDNPAIKLDAEKRKQIQDVLNEYVGSDKAGKKMLLEAGLSYKDMNLKPEDAQMLQTRAFNVEEICRWFRVPPFMIGHTEKVTSWGTGLEQQMLGFVAFCLAPYLTRIEQAINKRLLKTGERGRFYAKFSLEGLLRGDMKARAEFYQSALQNGWMTRAQVAALEDWDAISPLLGGDLYTIQSNLIVLSDVTKMADKPSLGSQPAPAKPGA